MSVRLKRWKTKIRFERKINKTRKKDRAISVRLKRWKRWTWKMNKWALGVRLKRWKSDGSCKNEQKTSKKRWCGSEESWRAGGERGMASWEPTAGIVSEHVCERAHMRAVAEIWRAGGQRMSSWELTAGIVSVMLNAHYRTCNLTPKHVTFRTRILEHAI